MKEIENPLDHKEEIEVVAQKQQEKQFKLIGQMRPQNGQKVFEVNCTSGECNEAQFQTVAVNFITAAKGDNSAKKKIIAKENCMYIVALNKKNALKKFFLQLRKATVIK
jgi:hypothetical protein